MRALAIAGGGLYAPEPLPKYRGNDAFVWGLIRGAKELMRAIREDGKSFYQVDHAYIGREQFFRITKNGLQKTEFEDRSPDRLEQLLRFTGRAFPKRRKALGKKILVCLSTESLYEFHGSTSESWLDTQLNAIREHSDRHIVIRQKSFNGLEADLQDVACVVSHSSAVSMDALFSGISVHVTHPCAYSSVSVSIENIDEPPWPENLYEWMSSLAWGQFHTSELINPQVLNELNIEN